MAVQSQTQITASFRSEQLDQVSAHYYRGFLGNLLGWFRSHFDGALRIYDEKAQRNFYLNLSTFAANLCFFPLEAVQQFDKNLLSSSKKLNRLTLEALNPVIGQKLTANRVQDFVSGFLTKEYFYGWSGTNLSEKVEHCSVQLEKWKNRDLQVIRFDKETLLKHLKPGDIFFKKQPDDTKNVVVLAQRFISHLMFGKRDREGHKYSHAAIYLGDGKVAEAVPNHGGSEVRILNIDDPKFALDPKEKTQYLISRCKDEELAKTAAEIGLNTALAMGPQEDSETVFKYTKFQAARSIWHPACFGPMARYRYLKQYTDDHNKQLPKDFIALKSFFCSYFVGYCFQTAESRTVMPALLGETSAPLNGLTSVDSAIFRGLWARVKRWQAWGSMTDSVKMQFDAKRLTPQNLRNFIVGHQHGSQFEDRILVKT